MVYKLPQNFRCEFWLWIGNEVMHRRSLYSVRWLVRWPERRQCVLVLFTCYSLVTTNKYSTTIGQYTHTHIGQNLEFFDPILYAKLESEKCTLCIEKYELFRCYIVISWYISTHIWHTKYSNKTRYAIMMPIKSIINQLNIDTYQLISQLAKRTTS